MGAITRKGVWAIVLIPLMTYSTQVDTLPKRIRIRTSDEFNQALLEISNALESLSKTTLTIQVTLDSTPTLIGGLFSLMSVPSLIQSTHQYLLNPSKAQGTQTLMWAALFITGLLIIFQPKLFHQQNAS